MESPKCLQCAHYFSTYDPKVPRGCKAYGFRSLGMPSTIIERETNRPCMAFKQNAHFSKKSGDNKKRDDLGFLDPKLWD
jgi:predicted  nucleic acid-binding Zn-ribbon protein